jgi:hypothetical protein
MAIDANYMDSAVMEQNKFTNFVKSMELPKEEGRSKDGRYVQLAGIKEQVSYWDDPRIHNFGNNSFISALAAPIATKIIDMKAYEGVD